MNELKDVNKLTIDHFRKQTYFIDGPIDFVGKQENFSSDLQRLSNFLGREIKDVQKNVGDKLSTELNLKCKKLIENIYEEDFEFYESH